MIKSLKFRAAPLLKRNLGVKIEPIENSVISVFINAILSNTSLSNFLALPFLFALMFREKSFLCLSLIIYFNQCFKFMGMLAHHLLVERDDLSNHLFTTLTFFDLVFTNVNVLVYDTSFDITFLPAFR
ncbi:MAG: hypothetical protein LBJ67_18500 [Planctomycetaceae bacterium]|nr:hypothetical protein [Planctomycetaceae bacterium]